MESPVLSLDSTGCSEHNGHTHVNNGWKSPGPASITPAVHLRSCIFCRHRKIRCDRQQPCSNCERASSDCIYPTGRGRAPKRPRRAVQAQLDQRLSRLEALIRHLGDASSASLSQDLPTGTSDRVTPNTSSGGNGSINQQLGRLMIDETKSFYVGHVLWANLGNEIEELRDTLHQSSSDEEEDEYLLTDSSISESNAVLGSNAAILGFSSLTLSLQSYHPPLSQSASLLGVFTENVAPVVCIFHIPTATRLYWDAIASVNQPDKNTEALLFSIYYSTVISMDPEQCMAILGLTRNTALRKYRFATEQAMARANLLNTQSIILLQAAVLYLNALRNEDYSRTVWSLTSLIFHIAQAMGLHRDGTTFGLKPLETELRRRLWYHICLLDNRSCEYHGCEPIVHEFVFDTQPPLHINDSDLNSEMTRPPLERNEWCDMTLCVMRCEATRVDWKVNNIPNSRQPASYSTDTLSLEERQTLIEELENRFEEKYLKYCDINIPFQMFCSTVARIIIKRFWLVVNYPLGRRQGVGCENNMRDQLFRTSVEILELSVLFLTNKDFLRWMWHSKTHVQWHAVAFVLSEICVRQSSPECDHAWNIVCTVYDGWKTNEDGKEVKLWKPIRRLLAKARYVREMQKMDLGERVAGVNISAQSSKTNSTGYTLDESFPKELGIPDLQRVLDMKSLDPIVELFPNGWPADSSNLMDDIFSI